MIQQCEDEFRRQEATQFERIYPDEELGETFAPLFETQVVFPSVFDHTTS